MSLFGNLEFNSLEDLLRNQLEDLYDTENRILEIVPKLIDASVSPELKRALDKHLRQTRNQVTRLDSIFHQFGQVPKRGMCAAMKGMLDEAEEMTGATGNPEVRDAALIAVAQRIEHYEIACYGAARTFAARLGKSEAARLLQATLDEEAAADRTLTQVAQGEVNAGALP